MKKKFFVLSLLALLITLIPLTNVFAGEGIGEINESPLINNNSILLNEDEIKEQIEKDLNDNIEPQGPRYEVRNIRHVSNVYRLNEWIDKATGNTGQTLSLSVTHGFKGSVDGTFGVSGSKIAAEIGFTLGKEYKYTSSSSQKVPSNVKRATLTAYPYYQKYEYDVYMIPRRPAGLPDVHMGSGVSYKPNGTRFILGDYVY